MKKRKAKVQALLLFSGGLDSILAAKILEKQGVLVTALAFTSYFFGAGQAKKSARENNIKLITKDISKKHLEIVKNPCFGWGTGMNPCIDCHLLMLKQAKILVRSGRFDFIATGEVLGQRPMSQNREALKLIERKAGLAGEILRPLSAKLLPAALAENVHLVGREHLYAFQGRSRKAQIELAKKLGIKNYPSPAGGCILTNKEYSKKLRELLENVKGVKLNDIKLLRIGRHFWSGKTRVVLGRNHEENLKLKKIAEESDMIIEPKNFPGPTALVRGKNKRAVKFARDKIIKYAKKEKNQKLEFIVSVQK